MDKTLIESLREQLEKEFKKLDFLTQQYLVEQAMSPNMIFLRQASEERINSTNEADWEYETNKEGANYITMHKVYQKIMKQSTTAKEQSNKLSYLRIIFDFLQQTNPQANENIGFFGDYK